MKGLFDFLLHPPEWIKPPEWMILILWVCFTYATIKLLLFAVPPVTQYLRASVSGVQISFLNLFGMWLRNGTKGTRTIVDALIAAQAHRVSVRPMEIEILHLSQGDVGHAVLTMGCAKQAGIELTWQEASTLELRGSGKELLEAVRTAAQSKDTGPLDELKMKAQSDHTLPAKG